MLRDSRILSVDTETSGLDPYTCKLWCIQIADENTAIFFPWIHLSESSKNKLRILLADKTMIAHNAKFDVKFLKHNGFIIGRVWCTMVTEQVLCAGRYFTFKLSDVLLRRYQITMDKSVRDVFWDPNGPSQMELWVREFGEDVWTEHPEIVEYGLTDIEYLYEIFMDQRKEMKELGMTEVIKLENGILPEVSSMELRGVYMDKKDTKKFESLVMQKRDELDIEVRHILETTWKKVWAQEYARRREILDVWKEEHEKIKEQAKALRKEGLREDAKKLMDTSNSKKPYTKIPLDNPFNIGSPVKMKATLSHLVGFEIPTTNADWLEEHIELHPVIALIMEWRKFQKLTEFCQHVEKINHVTGRIHGSFHQAGTKSGRFSSSDPNLQQIPARYEEAKEFRGLFRPKPGCKFVGADLAGIELVIMAYLSKEDALLEAIQNGDDIHCFTMSKILGCPYEILVGLKAGTITESDEFSVARHQFESEFRMPELLAIESPGKWVKKFRDYVKTMTYGIAYGQTAYGASAKFHCDFKVAEKLIEEKYFGVYPHMKVWLRSCEEVGYQQGFASNRFGRRRWFFKPTPPKYEDIEASVLAGIKKEGRNYDSISEAEWYFLMEDAIKKATREYNSRINRIKRQAANFIPQSMCADMIKTAMLDYSQTVSGEDKGLILTIHDELIVEVPENEAVKSAELLELVMENAVERFLPGIQTKVDAKISDQWEK